jgi:phosphoribosylformimino-5-aminoimidazole carboxamide ribotide isomerase
MLEEWQNSSIEVIPAVDVLGGGAVRLHRGDYAEVVERPGNPVDLARSFGAAGAIRIHLVDLDGARSGRVRPELVREVAAAVAPAKLQASGGVRSLADAQALLAAGADRVIVGTAAFPEPEPWVAALGDQLAVALDVRDGRVRTSGWTEEGLALAEAVERCARAGVVRVLCTAIDRDGTLSGPDLELIRSVAGSGLRVLAAGGIRSPADVADIAAAGAEAAVVGRALVSASSGPHGSQPSGSS